MSLDTAIAVLGTEIAAYQQGTSTQPSEGTADWYLLRAKSLGLSCLKRQKQLQIENDPGACERHYKAASSATKELGVPPAPVIVPETIPDAG